MGSFSNTFPLFPSGLLGNAGFQWLYVRQRFQALLENLKITADQGEDGETKHKGIVTCLNKAYWNTSSDSDNRLLIGSWGKHTRVRPPRDIDLQFTLPVQVYWRFQQRSGNRQSQLLQELRSVLGETYSATDIRGDGQVIVVPFNSIKVEVAPGFLRQGGGYLVCDTYDGGNYKHVDPVAEIAALEAADQRFNGNVRKLTRILKQWQRNCDVPIKSFHLEALVTEMLSRVSYGGSNEFWFDWLVRDAFAHMIGRANGWFTMPVTNEIILLGEEWLGRARTAYRHALVACDYEYRNLQEPAGDEWQKIFGTMVPVKVI